MKVDWIPTKDRFPNESELTDFCPDGTCNHKNNDLVKCWITYKYDFEKIGHVGEAFYSIHKKCFLSDYGSRGLGEISEQCKIQAWIIYDQPDPYIE